MNAIRPTSAVGGCKDQRSGFGAHDVASVVFHRPAPRQMISGLLVDIAQNAARCWVWLASARMVSKSKFGPWSPVTKGALMR